MSAGDGAGSFGPYAFALTPAEAEAAAARFGLRSALRGGLIANHLAPLAIFILLMLFASILALAGFIGRRAAEATILFAAAAFMIQRLATHRRIQRARRSGRGAIASLEAGALTVTVEDDGVAFTGAKRARRLAYADCEDAEDAGGLLYLWPRDGAPIVLPTRALADGEAARLLERIRGRIGEKKP
jgi:hypothetical protein